MENDIFNFQYKIFSEVAKASLGYQEELDLMANDFVNRIRKGNFSALMYFILLLIFLGITMVMRGLSFIFTRTDNANS